MAGAGGTDRLKVFISYSRKDLKFADQLDAALDLTGFDSVIDRQGISGAEDWKKRLGDLIRDADTIVFVLSPSSASSDVCAWEVEEAARLKKRIIPVICDPLGDVAPPPVLQSLNYIFFYDEPKVPGSGFGAGLASLVRSLNTDLEWIREHTRLLARATEWEVGGRADNRLLFGSVIADAKAWIVRRPKDAPEPTALHLDYIRASEQAEAQRHDEQRQQVERMAVAQDERARALEEKEEAFKQVAAAQRTRARIRNYAFVGMGLMVIGMSVVAKAAIDSREDARAKQAEAEERKSQAEVHLIMAREMTSLALLSGAQASIRTQTKALNIPNIDFQVFRIEGDFVQNVSEIIGNVASGRDNMTDQLKDIDKEARETVARNEEAFFKLAHGAAQILVGDTRLAAGDVATAIGHYESGLESVNASMVKLNYYFEPNHLTQARGHGRIGAARQLEGNSAAAETAYKTGLALMEDAIAKGNSTPQIEGEKAWFTERLASLKGQPAAAAEAQGSPATAEPPAAPPAP